MSKLIKTLFIIGITVSCNLFSTSFAAERVYESGSVWAVSFVRTKPGKYDEYLADLHNVWLKYIKAQMKDGDILSYKMMDLTGRRNDESNLILMVEFKNWATFDRDAEYFDKIAEKVQGSVAASTKANIDRESLRTLNGGMTLQEVKFKK
ncbi:MAG: hypothetical protein ACI9IA_002419 [Enterobacterales bacterium]|jgi:hypothetical protein